MLLHEVLEANFDAQVFSKLLDTGADVDAVDPGTGEAPLHVAVRRRRLEPRRALLVLVERAW